MADQNSTENGKGPDVTGSGQSPIVPELISGVISPSAEKQVEDLLSEMQKYATIAAPGTTTTMQFSYEKSKHTKEATGEEPEMSESKHMEKSLEQTPLGQQQSQPDIPAYLQGQQDQPLLSQIQQLNQAGENQTVVSYQHTKKTTTTTTTSSEGGQNTSTTTTSGPAMEIQIGSGSTFPVSEVKIEPELGESGQPLLTSVGSTVPKEIDIGHDIHVQYTEHTSKRELMQSGGELLSVQTTCTGYPQVVQGIFNGVPILGNVVPVPVVKTGLESQSVFQPTVQSSEQSFVAPKPTDPPIQLSPSVQPKTQADPTSISGVQSNPHPITTPDPNPEHFIGTQSNQQSFMEIQSSPSPITKPEPNPEQIFGTHSNPHPITTPEPNPEHFIGIQVKPHPITTPNINPEQVFGTQSSQHSFLESRSTQQSYFESNPTPNPLPPSPNLQQFTTPSPNPPLGGFTAPHPNDPPLYTGPPSNPSPSPFQDSLPNPNPPLFPMAAPSLTPFTTPLFSSPQSTNPAQSASTSGSTTITVGNASQLEEQLKKLGISAGHPVSELLQQTLAHQRSKTPETNIEIQYSAQKTHTTRTITYGGPPMDESNITSQSSQQFQTGYSAAAPAMPEPSGRTQQTLTSTFVPESTAPQSSPNQGSTYRGQPFIRLKVNRNMFNGVFDEDQRIQLYPVTK